MSFYHRSNKATYNENMGIQIDPKMNWKAHREQAKRKGEAQLEALARIAASTWDHLSLK